MFLKKFLILIDRVFLRSSLSKFNSKLVKNKLEKNLNYRITVRYNKSDKNLFTELCDFYGSDKGSQGSNLVYPWPAHTYSDFYSTIFSNFRSSVKKVYENGIGTNNTNLTSNMSSTGIPGASLRVWRDYFPNSIVIGTDIDRDILFQEERIKTFFIDQTNEQIIQHFWNECGEDNFDLMVDDGLHIASAGKTLFMNSIKYLSDSGLYIIEDVGLKDLIVYEDFFKRTNYLVNYVSLFRPGLDNRNNNLITIRKTS
jgi:hypothetical protein